MAAKEIFHHGDILKIIPDLKPITLIKWCERDIITPAYEPPTGAGKREFDRKGLLRAFLVNELVSYGITAPMVKHFLKIDKNGQELLPDEKRFRDGDYTGLTLYIGRISLAGTSVPPELRKFLRTTEGSRIMGVITHLQLNVKVLPSVLIVNLEALEKDLNQRLAEEGWL